MSATAAIWRLVAARVRRRPGRCLSALTGTALAITFGGFVLVEGTVAAEQGAHSVFASASALDRATRLTWQGPVTAPVQQRAHQLMAQLGGATMAEVVLLNPVRLGGVLVRPAAIAPFNSWTRRPAPGACTASRCPMLVAGAGGVPRSMSTLGVRIAIVGTAQLRSAAPLGFTPSPAGGPRLLLTGDVGGLEKLAGLSGVYRTHSWVTTGSAGGPHEWQLADVQRRLQRVQATVELSAQFGLSAPFALLDAARAQADSAPRRLALAGGGALAALAAFIVLVAAALRADVGAELRRLRSAGATEAQCVSFVVSEAALLCGLGLLIGIALALGLGAIVAGATSIPVGGLLANSLLTPVALAAAVGGWVVSTVLIATTLLAACTRIVDLLAVVAASALAVVLIAGIGGGAVSALLAPLCCVCAGVVAFRGAAWALRGSERLARDGPLPLRLALVGLARAPGGPSLAVAFIAVSTALGGFAIAYRATLQRASSDQAAYQVPLDAVIAPGSDFVRPLELRSLPAWTALAHGQVLPVRRTDASFVSGSGSVTVPALGVPASALPELRGWRSGQASAPLTVLAHQLVPPGRARDPGPTLGAHARFLALRGQASALALAVIADLRASDGGVRQLPLGVLRSAPVTLRARLPAGAWELEALELDEPTGLQATAGHQNAESPTGASDFSTAASLGALEALSAGGRLLQRVPLDGWRGVGAASAVHAAGTGAVLRFSAAGEAGIVRPSQPVDVRPLPVLVDPQTAIAAGQRSLISLSIDGAPVRARVVGVLARFPTLPASSAGFVVADQRQLADAIDAQSPGQGRPDELWVRSSALGPLRSALTRPPLSGLAASFRIDIERSLRRAPITRHVVDALTVAAVVAAALAALGLLLALLGPARDPRVEQDLLGLGLGPAGVVRELRLRMLLTTLLGVVCGLVAAALLVRLAVAAVRAAGSVANPQPPLLAAVPWAALLLWGLAVFVVLAAVSYSAVTPRTVMA